MTSELLAPAPDLQADQLFLGIDHLAIAVPDLNEAIRWFHGTLGFTVDERRETSGLRTGMKSAVLSNGPVTLVLTQGLGKQSQTSQYVDKHGPGVQHVAFRVADLDEAVQQLRAQGMEFSTPLLEGEDLSQIFSVRHPASGMMVELIERRNGYTGFHDGNVQRLFDALEKQELY
ncbi:VOC family protein [Massilia sp. W12]|uniref:VOC family protein n=1 Tax=Massilia sp. W12 TaxID=3126507 RepID=UPI0030CBE559